MKKRIAGGLAAVMMSASVMLSCLSMSGCSDFSFNPIGSWKLTSDKIYCDGQFFRDEKPGYITDTDEKTGEEKNVYVGDIVYNFGKSGRGTICVDDGKQSVKTQEFTYVYTDNEITLSVWSDYSLKKNLENATVKLAVETDKDGSTVLKNQSDFTANDTEGKAHSFNEILLYSRK